MEGAVYVVENLIVRDAVGTLKPVSSDLCIRFSNASTFKPCLDNQIIQLYKFEFMDLDDIFAEASKLGEKENPEFAIGKSIFIQLNIYIYIIVLQSNCFLEIRCNWSC